MGKEILTFVDIEIEKNKLYRYKSPIFLWNVDINNILVSSKISSGGNNYKYFIAYFLMLIIKLSHYI